MGAVPSTPVGRCHPLFAACLVIELRFSIRYGGDDDGIGTSVVRNRVLVINRAAMLLPFQDGHSKPNNVAFPGVGWAVVSSV